MVENVPRLLLPLEQGARQLAVSRRTLLREHARGRLTLIRVGGVWRVEPEELARYIERNREAPA